MNVYYNNNKNNLVSGRSELQRRSASSKIMYTVRSRFCWYTKYRISSNLHFYTVYVYCIHIYDDGIVIYKRLYKYKIYFSFIYFCATDETRVLLNKFEPYKLYNFYLADIVFSHRKFVNNCAKTYFGDWPIKRLCKNDLIYLIRWKIIIKQW